METLSEWKFFTSSHWIPYDGTQNGRIPFESSTYGSKFVALHIAYEMLLAFRTSRMLGMSTNSPDDVFRDNNIWYRKYYSGIGSYKEALRRELHKSQRTITAEAMRISHEPTESNLDDLLSKNLAGPRQRTLSGHILR